MEPNRKSGFDSGKRLTRKQAIQKVGITALTSASLIFLSTPAGAANSKTKKPKKPGR